VIGPKATTMFESEPSGKLASEYLLTDLDPKAKRVVFICTPHKGADMADQFLGRIGRSLIHLPSKLAGNLSSVPEAERILFTGGGKGMPTSVSSLSPENATLKVMSSVKVEPPAHTIVGTGWGAKKPLKESSDGVVANDG